MNNEKCNENRYLKKIDFYEGLKIEHILIWDSEHFKRVWKRFGRKKLGKYHDFSVQIDTLLLADVLKSFQNNRIGIYNLDSPHFLSARRLAWKAALKMANKKRTFNWHWNVIYDRKMYKRWNMSSYSSVRRM